jgi:hypothetical protein
LIVAWSDDCTTIGAVASFRYGSAAKTAPVAATRAASATRKVPECFAISSIRFYVSRPFHTAPSADISVHI